MELEAITRQEQIIAGKDLQPVTRMEFFLKAYGGGSSGGGSIPKPLTYDYMPEGYPKKDGWSIEWDGNTEGKLYIPTEKGYGFCKISDMVPTDDDLLGATVEFLDYPGNTVMIGAGNIDIASDDVIYVDASFSSNSVQGNISLVIAIKDNIYIEGSILPEKGVYAYSDIDKFKMSKENIIPMSTDFISKNLNVVFRATTGDTPTSCNVAYDELRGWVENGIPVFAVFIKANFQYNIIGIALLTDALGFIYFINTGESKGFLYKSDGTIEPRPSV